MRKPGPPREIPPPLEMVCLKALWTLGEGSVNDVREVVSKTKPLAYTTVMTLLDRLAKKKVLSRRKVGRAFVYSPQMPADAIRRLALQDFVDMFFDGSTQKLLDYLRRPEPDGAPVLEYESTIDTALL